MSSAEMLETAAIAALVAMALWFCTMALAAILTVVVRHPWAALWHAFALCVMAYFTAFTADHLTMPVWVIFAASWLSIQVAALGVREMTNHLI